MKAALLFTVICLAMVPGIVSAASVTLAWDPPTQNSDGSPLLDLSGYQLYYGTSPGIYDSKLNAGNIPQYTVFIPDALALGRTYYFSVTAYDASGNESTYSNEISHSFAVPLAYTVTTSVTPAGSGSVSGGGSYPAGATATLSASPAAGYRFSAWSGAVSGSSNPVSLTVNGNKSVTASFVPVTYTVTTSVTPAGSGSVSGGGSYPAGATATLSASPATGYRFAGWSGDATGTVNPLVVTINSGMNIVAKFQDVKIFNLSTWSNPPAGGSVSGGGIFNMGSMAVVTAVPAPGYKFAGWTGNSSGNANPLILRMNRNKSVTANFESSAYPLAATSMLGRAATICFLEDWETGSIDPARWVTWGSSPPQVTAPPEGGYSLALTGYPGSDGGVSGRTSFSPWDMALAFAVRSPDAGGIDQSVSVGLTGGASLVFIEVRGEVGLAGKRVRYVIPGEEYSEEIDGEWHFYQIHILTDGHVDFYRDGIQVYLTEGRMDLETCPPLSIFIGGSGQTEGARIDQIVLTPPPPPPIITTGGGISFSTDANPLTLEGTAVPLVQSLWLNDEQVAGFIPGSPTWNLPAGLQPGENLLALTGKDPWGIESEQSVILATFASAPGEEGPLPTGSPPEGCFIATAVYGSYEEPSVVLLREFRDLYLQTNPVGRAMVRFYYRVSPPIADWLRTRGWAKAAVRLILLPLISLAWLLVKAGPLGLLPFTVLALPPIRTGRRLRNRREDTPNRCSHRGRPGGRSRTRSNSRS